MIAAKNILVTGGAGFIGANFITFLINNYSQIQIVNLDNLTYAGNLDNLAEVENHKQYHFVKGDICDANLVNQIFENYSIDGVIHFAAESHVDNSIESPHNFITTNINGTFVLLEAAKKHWHSRANTVKEAYKNARFHHISTDEVYGSLNDDGFFAEETPYAPNSPYSASKAASDFLVRSYYHTYGLNVVTSNCSNNYGPKQHDEKLIPKVIKKALTNEPIPIYGDGKNVRDWLYVLDHCKGIEKVFALGKSGDTYVMGGDNTQNNVCIVHAICDILDVKRPKNKGKYSDQIRFVKDRLGHDYRYAIDSTKIKKELGWRPLENFDSGILKTVEWYLKKYEMNHSG